MANLLVPEDSGFEVGPTSWLSGWWFSSPNPNVVVERTQADAFAGLWSLWVARQAGSAGAASSRLAASVVEGQRLFFSGRMRLADAFDPTAPVTPGEATGVAARFIIQWSNQASGFTTVFNTEFNAQLLGFGSDWVELGGTVVVPESYDPVEVPTDQAHVGVELSSSAAVLVDEIYFGPLTADAVSDVDVASAAEATAARGVNVDHPVDVDATGTAGLLRDGDAATPVDVTAAGSSALEREASVAADLLPPPTAFAEVAWDPPATSRPMPVPVIEAALGQPWATPLDELVWTPLDVCARLLRKDEGRPRILDDVEPGTCRMVLDNRDGKLDPSNTESPLWGDGRPGVDFGTWMRVSLDVGDGPAVWFVGTVDRLHPTWHLGDAVVEIDLVDALSLLAQSRLETSVLRQEVLSDPDVVHFWPMSESGAVIQDIAGARDGVWSDGVSTSESLTPWDPSRCTVLPAGDGDTTPVSGTIGSVDLDGEDWTLGFVVEPQQIDVPDNEMREVVLVSLPGSTSLELVFRAEFSVTQVAYLRGLRLRVTGEDPFVTPIAPPTPIFVLIANDATAGQLRVRIQSPKGSITSSPMFRSTALTLDDVIRIRPDDEDRGEVRIQEMFVIARALSNAELDELRTAAFAPWATDSTAGRFERLCDMAGLPSVVDGSGWPDASPAVISESDNMLRHIGEAANGDGATVSVDLDADGAPLYRQTDPDDVVMWWDTRGVLGAPLRDVDPVYGIDRIARTVKVRRGTGEKHAASDPSSPYPTSAELEVDTLLGSPAVARDRAALLLVDRRKPRYLFQSIECEGRDARVPSAGLFLRPGDHVGLLAHPPGRAQLVQIARVERIEQLLDFRAWSWHIEYGVDRVTMFITWDDLVDRHDDWDDVIAEHPTWFDVLASGEPNPPEGS